MYYVNVVQTLRRTYYLLSKLWKAEISKMQTITFYNEPSWTYVLRLGRAREAEAVYAQPFDRF